VTSNDTVLLETEIITLKDTQNRMNSFFPKQGILTIILITISTLTIFTFSSCKKDDDSNSNNATVTNDNFYFKYVIKGNGAYGHFSNWTATTPQGKYTNSGTQVGYWTQTYGPVKKGFKCEIKIGDYINGNPTIEIHASKNQEPFALKVTKTGNSASYTIDF
jgi:hypothetical protein